MSTTSLADFNLPPAFSLFLRRHVNLHRVVLVLTSVLFFIAWNRGLALLYGVFSFFLALLLLSYLLPMWQLRKLRVGLKTRGDFRVGERATLECRLWAPSPRQHLTLRVILPFANNKTAAVFFVQADNHSSEVLTLVCDLRGCFSLTEVEVECCYPFGIFSYRKTIAINALNVVVLPAIIQLEGSPQGRQGNDYSLGTLLTPRSGGADEFTSVRDYRAGDELRHIHWSASARTLNWVVKEYEHRCHQQLIIVLNTRRAFNLGEGNGSSFEMAVRLVAALVARATNEGIPCTLAAEPSLQLTVPAYTQNLYSLYEQLAYARSDSDRPYAALVEEALLQHPHAHMLMTLRTDQEPAIETIPAHLTHIEVLVDSKSFRFPAQIAMPHRGERQGQRLTFNLRANARLEALFQ